MVPRSVAEPHSQVGDTPRTHCGDTLPRANMGVRASEVCLCVLLSSITVVAGSGKDYTGYKVLRITPSDPDGVNWVHTLEQHGYTVSYWKLGPKPGMHTDVMLNPAESKRLQDHLDEKGLVYSLIIEDVQSLADKNRRLRRSAEMFLSLDLHQYNRYDAISDWMRSLAVESPNLIDVVTIGTSTEGRELLALKIGLRDDRPSVFVECGIHAREWITSAVCVNLIHMLTNDVLTERTALMMLWQYNWYILPLTNPDGYEYSHTEDRMWRKTRSSQEGAVCVGVDPNRNFGYKWGYPGTEMTNTCSEVYIGPSAFSEPETAAVRDFILNHEGAWRMYVALHSYGQDILVPWSYDTVESPDFHELKDVATIGAKAIRKATGAIYTADMSSLLMGSTPGVSDDWAKGEAGIQFSYTIEMRDTGRHGFLLPASEIPSTSNDIFAALGAMANELFRKESDS